jgi:hypothetical protein
MQKWFSGREFVAAGDARRCSGFVRIAIADRSIAVQPAALKPGAGNAALPTAVTSRVWRVDSTIATGNGSTGDVMGRLA